VHWHIPVILVTQEVEVKKSQSGKEPEPAFKEFKSRHLENEKYTVNYKTEW
jgi:hypothetical protein